MLIPLTALLLQASDQDWDALRSRLESAPQAVATFIERRAGCNHFLGEERYDPERSREIDAALTKLRCLQQEGDELKLRRIYRAQPKVLKLLDDTKDILSW